MGRLELIGDPSLASLDGLDNLTTVEEVYLYDMPALVSVSALARVSGELTTIQLLELPALVSVGGFEGIEEPPSLSWISLVRWWM